MADTMTEQVVLMTGCSSGIGLATVKRLVHHSDQRFIIVATVIAMSENTELISAVGNALDKTVFVKELDVTKDDDILRVVDDVIQTHGRIDILINVAGITCIGVAERISRAQIDQVMNVNAIGTIRLTQAVLVHMKKKRAGKIITITSVAGRQGCPYFEMYCASKFAVEGFFEALVTTVRSFNISVCLVEPGPIKTGFMDQTRSHVEAQINDDSIDDFDRRGLSVFLDLVASRTTETADNVAEALVTRCVDVANPVLRHLIGKEKLNESIAQGCADVTGETSVAAIQKNFGFS